MTTQQKYDSALALIEEHNKAIADSEGQLGTIDPEKFIWNLKLYGAISEDDLKKLSYEEILECLKPATNHADSSTIAPKGLAKKLAAEFRSGEKEKTGEAPVHVTRKKADAMTPLQLVEHFDPEYPESNVAKRLETISKGQAFIVFKEGRTVDAKATYALLMEIRQGFSARDIIVVDGIPKRVYKLGELPDNEADENPVFAGRPLRPDGTCDQTNRSWAGVSDECRQFVWYVLKSGEMKVSAETAHYLLDLILAADDPFKKLVARYPKVYPTYELAKAKGLLPRLKIALGGHQGAAGRPFDQGKQVVWIAPANPALNYYQPVKWKN